MLKLLFVEDDPSAIEPVLRLTAEHQDMDHRVCDFEDAKQKIRSVLPDIVIIDLVRDISEVDPSDGFSIRDFVWNSRFCPIVVYSAWSDLHDSNYDQHPFIKSVQKGKGSPQRVLKALQALQPHVAALKKAEGHIRQLFSHAIRDVAPDAFRAHTDGNRRNDTVLRAGRRRLAALVDDLPTSVEKLAPWEQYLCPPISVSPQTGEVIRSSAGCADAPCSFRVVLTPSCDMVTTGNRQPKTRNILVAKCCSMREGLERTRLQGLSTSKLQDRLRSSLLTRGSLDGLVPFPALSGRIPTMMADLRDLELIPLAKIDGIHGGKEYARIASIDSPFREAVTWAYLQNAGRPGLPDRDLEAWCGEILDSVKAEDRDAAR